MEHYILKIYRRGGKRAKDFLGTIETIETEDKRSFRSGEDFVSLLDVPRVRPIALRSRIRAAVLKHALAYAAAVMAVAGVGLLLFLREAESSIISWSLEPGIRLEGGWPGAPCVIYAGKDKLRMYFNDSYGSQWAHFYPIVIKSAISGDGLSWAREPGVRLGKDVPGFESWCASPSVIIIPDKGFYRMFYASDDNGSILSATSVEGLSWTPEGVKIRPESVRCASVGSPSVIRVSENLFRMYFAGYDGAAFRIYSAVSADEGATWTPETGVRIDTGRPGAFDESGCVNPVVIRLENGLYDLFYSGWGGQPRANRILSAVSSDGLIWRKEAGARLKPEDLPGGANAYPAGVSPGGVIQLSKTRFRMYVTGDRSVYAPGYLTDNRFVIFSVLGTFKPTD